MGISRQFLRYFSPKRRGVSLQPKFSKQQPWKDLNKPKERREATKKAEKVKWVVSSHHKGMEDSLDFFETAFENGSSQKARPSSSFDEIQVTQPGQDDAWNFSSIESGPSGSLSDPIVSLSEPTTKAKQQGKKLKQYLQQTLVDTDKVEVTLPGQFDHVMRPAIESTVKDLGLHWRVYGAKGSEISVVSKYPLANYRPEFDPRTKTRHKVEVDHDILNVVRLTLNTISMERYQDDWVERPDDMKGKARADTGGQPETTKDSATPNIAEKEDSESSDQDEYATPEAVADVSFHKVQNLHQMSAEDVHRLQQRCNFVMSTEGGRKMLEARQSLPSWSRRAELLDSIRRNQVLIVSGETGCGKTTQLPQFILEDAIASGHISETNIVVTQPRRISAMSVSQRVADERCESLGDLVGYQVRMNARRSPNTRLLFCTSGVLLRTLISDPRLEHVSYVIVDEIHERGMNEDFLLIILRNLLPKRPDLRLILMSATLDAETFSTYFGNAPMIHIPGFMHPIKEFFIEDVIEQTGYQISSSDRHLDRKLQWYQKAKSLTENTAMLNYVPRKSDFIGYKERTFGAVQTWASCANAKLHYGLIEATIEHICNYEEQGGVLVFLTSWDDIQTLMELLESNPVVGNTSRVKLLPLHSTLASISQEEIFKTPPVGIRKVVLATNIAETSITINDIVYVVNAGKAKEKSYDALNKIACLFPTWISKASCTQRKGRAGRVQPGHVYHLFPRSMYEHCFMDHQLPEIMRTPLAELCLQIKSLGLGCMQEFLTGAMNPPSPQTVQNAILHLKSIGAIDAQQDLTPLGRHLAHIPVEPSIGKMILMGAIFGCLDPCLTLAAASAVKDPFQRPTAFRKEVDAIKLNLAAGTCSDHIALLRAFEGYREARSRGTASKWNYCKENFFTCQSFDQMDQMRLHFAELLANIGFLKIEHSGQQRYHQSPSGRYSIPALEDAIYAHSRNSATLELLRAVLCSGVFPSIAAVINKQKRPQFLTLEDGTVRPHMFSVNGTAKFFPHRWLIYTDKVQTGGILFRNSTMITDLALLLFGGDVEIDKDTPGDFSILNGRYLFRADPEVAKVIVALRSELQSLLEKKIREPQIDIFEDGGTVVGAVMTLLSSEREPNNPEKPFTAEALEGNDVITALS